MHALAVRDIRMETEIRYKAKRRARGENEESRTIHKLGKGLLTVVTTDKCGTKVPMQCLMLKVTIRGQK